MKTWSPLVLGGVLFSLALLSGVSFDYAVERELWWARSTGYLALSFLVLALSVSPMRRRFPEALRPPLWTRRALGLTTFVLATGHLGVVLGVRLVPKLDLLITEPHPRAGAAAWLALLALFATSFGPVLRALRIHLWKQLHWLVYAALLLSVHHLALCPRADVRIVVGTAVGAGWLLAIRLLRKRVLKSSPVSG